MNWIDAHSHITDERAGQLAELLQAARARGIRYHLQGGVGPEDWARQLLAAKSHPEVLPAFGLHPYWVADHGAEDCEVALNLLARSLHQAAILGETGLDFREHILMSTKRESTQESPEEVKARQLDYFEAQLELAEFQGKPVCLHVVRAFEEAVKMLSFHEGRIKGFFHSFTGSSEQAKILEGMGFLISVGGAICARPKKLVKAVQEMDLDFLLLETDSPDQKPFDWPEELNQPLSLLNVAQTVAEIRGLTLEEVLDRSKSNLQRLIGSRWFL